MIQPLWLSAPFVSLTSWILEPVLLSTVPLHLHLLLIRLSVMTTLDSLELFCLWLCFPFHLQYTFSSTIPRYINILSFLFQCLVLKANKKICKFFEKTTLCKALNNKKVQTSKNFCKFQSITKYKVQSNNFHEQSITKKEIRKQ